MKLRYHYTLCTIDHKGATRCHIGDRPEIHVLDLCFEVYVLRVITRELEFCFKGNTVSEPSANTLLDRILRRVYTIVYKLESKAIACVFYRKVFGKYLVQPFLFSAFCSSLQLEEVLKRLKLHFQEIGIGQCILYLGKILSDSISSISHLLLDY